jgi:nucleoside-diphosphate-sugar epimerase
MKILVTGGSGFIAGALTARLLRENNKVFAFTRNRGKASLNLPDSVRIFEAELADAGALSRLDIKDMPDAVVHLAASLDYFGAREGLFRANVRGTANLLDWASKNGVKRFVFASSVEAMGPVPESGIPADENFRLAPVSPYGESKLRAERLVLEFEAEKKMEAVILRLGNVYGPPSPAFIMPVADAILKRGKLLKFLPLYRKRRIHPLFIDDAVDGIMKAVSRSGAKGVYILAGEEYPTIQELFEKVAAALNIPFSEDALKSGLGDAMRLALHCGLCRLRRKADLLAYFTVGSGGRIHRAYSIEKAARELGYAPQVRVEDGVHRTIEWAKKEGILPK